MAGRHARMEEENSKPHFPDQSHATRTDFFFFLTHFDNIKQLCMGRMPPSFQKTGLQTSQGSPTQMAGATIPQPPRHLYTPSFSPFTTCTFDLFLPILGIQDKKLSFRIFAASAPSAETKHAPIVGSMPFKTMRSLPIITGYTCTDPLHFAHWHCYYYINDYSMQLVPWVFMGQDEEAHKSTTTELWVIHWLPRHISLLPKMTTKLPDMHTGDTLTTTGFSDDSFTTRTLSFKGDVRTTSAFEQRFLPLITHPHYAAEGRAADTLKWPDDKVLYSRRLSSYFLPTRGMRYMKSS